MLDVYLLTHYYGGIQQDKAADQLEELLDSDEPPEEEEKVPEEVEPQPIRKMLDISYDQKTNNMKFFKPVNK